MINDDEIVANSEFTYEPELCEHGKPVVDYWTKCQIDRIREHVKQVQASGITIEARESLDHVLVDLWDIRHPCYTCFTTY